MIVEGLVAVFFALVQFVVGLLPDQPLPGWMSDLHLPLSKVWGYGAGLGAWVPWSLVGSAVGSVMVCAVLGFTIKVIRIVASFFTAGGGSAA